MNSSNAALLSWVVVATSMVIGAHAIEAKTPTLDRTSRFPASAATYVGTLPIATSSQGI